MSKFTLKSNVWIQFLFPIEKLFQPFKEIMRHYDGSYDWIELCKDYVSHQCWMAVDLTRIFELDIWF